MKPDEATFLLKLYEMQPNQCARGVFATEVASTLGIHHKRATYLLLKWTEKGWWEYGVSPRSGWFTPLGLSVGKDMNRKVGT
jgi:hypothetical protein